MRAPEMPAAAISPVVPDPVARQVPANVGGRALQGGAWSAPSPREDRLLASWWSMRPIRTLPAPARRCLLGCLGSGVPALVRAALWQDWPALAAYGITPAGAGASTPPGDPAMR